LTIPDSRMCISLLTKKTLSYKKRSWKDRHTSNHYNKIHKDAEYVGARILIIGFIVTMSQNKGGVQTLSPDEITYNGCTIVPITAKLCIFKLRHAVLEHLAKNLGCTQYAKTSTPTHLIVLILHTLITNMGTNPETKLLDLLFLDSLG